VAQKVWKAVGPAVTKATAPFLANAQEQIIRAAAPYVSPVRGLTGMHLLESAEGAPTKLTAKDVREMDARLRKAAQEAQPTQFTGYRYQPHPDIPLSYQRPYGESFFSIDKPSDFYEAHGDYLAKADVNASKPLYVGEMPDWSGYKALPKMLDPNMTIASSYEGPGRQLENTLHTNLMNVNKLDTQLAEQTGKPNTYSNLKYYLTQVLKLPSDVSKPIIANVEHYGYAGHGRILESITSGILKKYGFDAVYGSADPLNPGELFSFSEENIQNYSTEHRTQPDFKQNLFNSYIEQFDIPNLTTYGLNKLVKTAGEAFEQEHDYLDEEEIPGLKKEFLKDFKQMLKDYQKQQLANPSK
jgi:hypothetical protein